MRHRPTSKLLAAIAGLGLTVALAGPAVPAQAASTDRYIVTTRSATATDSKVKKLRTAKAPVGRQFRHVLHGFSAKLTDAQVSQLKDDPTVESVVRDTAVKASDVSSSRTGQQTNPPSWGLDRIDQRSGQNRSYAYNSTGAGVTAYVIDTGIKMDQPDFAGRASSGWDFYDNDSDASDCPDNYQDDPDSDLISHGTHVAGTIGGQSYGVAKDVALVSLRVLGCDGGGWSSDVIAALDWVASNHPKTPSVVNMSLGGGINTAEDAAVQAVIAAGVPVVVSAGNSGAWACNNTPARVPAALTVGASDDNDDQAWFTNWGSCVDLFAPGVDITSVGTKTPDASLTISGTSMAAPHVAGAVARYLENRPSAKPADVAAAMNGGASKTGIGDKYGSPDRLLYLDAKNVATAPTALSGSRSDKAKTATVGWGWPASNGAAPITGYRITRTGRDAAGRASATVDVSVNIRAYAFKGLKPGTAYTLTVQARNSFGLGAAASTKQTITALPGRPKITSATKGSKGKPVTIHVKWSKPTTGGAVKNYAVTATRSGSTKTVTVSGSARSATVSGLKKNKKYTVRLRASNDSGSGPTVTYSKTVKAR